MSGLASAPPQRQGTVSKAEAASAPGGGPAKKRRFSRRDSNAQVERIISEQFRGCGPMQVDCVRNEAGRTLREPLLHDKRSKKEEASSSSRSGTSYYQDLRRQFLLAGPSASGQLVPDKSFQVDTQLERALSLLLNPNTTKQSSGSFRSWLSIAEGANQRELVGILKAVATFCPSCNTGNQTAVILDVAKFLVRHDLQNKHPSETLTVKHVFDQAFACQFASMKKQDLARSQFLEIVGDSIGLVLDLKVLKEVMAHDGQWSALAAQLGSLVQSLAIGEKFFGFAWVHVASESISSFFQQTLEEHSRPLTAAACAAIKKKVFKQAESLHFGTILDQKRAINVEYRGDSQISILAHSLGEELSMRLGAACKSDSIGGSLESLCFEASLAVAFPGGPGCEASVVKDFNSARLAVNDYLSQQTIGSGDLLSELIKAKSALYLQLDPTFKIEFAWLQKVVGQEGVDKMKVQLLSMLPDGSSTSTLNSTMGELKSFMKGDFFKFSCRSAQGLAEALAGVLSSLQQGQPVNELQIKASPFLEQVSTRLPFYVKHQVDSTTCISGAPALKAIIKDLVSKVRANEQVTLDMVEPCQLYHHVFDHAEKKQLGEIVDKVIGQASVASFAKKSSSASGSAPATKTKKEKDIASSLFD